jgi:hypothetical protein
MVSGWLVNGYAGLMSKSGKDDLRCLGCTCRGGGDGQKGA